MIDSTLNHDTFTGDWNISYSNVGVSRLVAKVEADGGLIAEVSFIVTVNSSGVTVKKKSNVALGSFNDTEFGSFYNTADEAVYLIGPAGTNATKVDLVFFKGATSLNTIASPDDATAQSTFAAISGWSTKNQTRFNTSTITVAQFNVIGSVYKFPDFNTANSLTRINQLAENQVFMFKTQAGKLGLVKVVTLYRGDKIKMDVIVQQ
ncbi:MAG: hypothetical protein Q8M23_05120 [Bacteroidales bacterium]|nr:hypothetical protein [Bacteroidales bacterium]